MTDVSSKVGVTLSPICRDPPHPSAPHHTPPAINAAGPGWGNTPALVQVRWCDIDGCHCHRLFGP